MLPRLARELSVLTPALARRELPAPEFRVLMELLPLALPRLCRELLAVTPAWIQSEIQKLALKQQQELPARLIQEILFGEPEQCSVPAELDLQQARDSLYGRSRGSTMPGV